MDAHRRVVERRAHRRIVADHGVSLRIMPGHAAAIRDLSQGGVGLRTSRRLGPGATIELRVETRGFRASQRAIVSWSRVERLEPCRLHFIVGLQFTCACNWLSNEELTGVVRI